MFGKGKLEVFRRLPVRAVLFIALVASTFLLTGCGLTEDDPMSTINPAGEAGDIVQNIYGIVFILSVVVFVLVEGALVFVLIKYRNNPRSGHGRPKPVHGNTRLEVLWTVIPAIILVVIAIPTLQGIADLAEESDENFQVTVYGHQFYFEFEYPEYDGLNVDNELHVPVGQRVELTLISKDVIHSFWIPRLAGKTDIMPGQTNHMWFEASEPGTYIGQCAELCGVGHAEMRMSVVAETPEDFAAWVEAEQAAPSDPVAEGREIFMTICATCHTIDGTEADGVVGPNLTNIASSPTIAGVLENTPENLRIWVEDPPAVKPGTAMPALGLTNDELDYVVAFLETLE